MKSKQLFLAVSIFAALAFGQNHESVNTSGSVANIVGRNRPVVEGTQLPGLHNPVHIVARHPKAGCEKTEVCGSVFKDEWTENLVTNAGLNWLADIMSNTTTPSVNTQCNFIGLTNTAITPAGGDTTLTGEIAANGLSRAQATYAHTGSATTYTLTKIFTATGAQSAQAGAVFTAVSGGTMCFEDTFTSATLATGDTLSITWTVTI